MSKVFPGDEDSPQGQLELPALSIGDPSSCDSERQSSFNNSYIELCHQRSVPPPSDSFLFGPNPWYPFRGLKNEFLLRVGYYFSDFEDGIKGPKTIQKLLSTIAFLYFACLLPDVAFGALNDDNTNGGLNVRKVIIAQGIGGIVFSLFGGQPMIILLSTAPLALYIKLIYSICEELGYDFFAMYACVGLFCCIFLIIYSVTELGSLMKFSTRSMEEIFSLFIAIDFTSEGIRAARRAFLQNYDTCHSSSLVQNASSTIIVLVSDSCHRDTAILFVLLMLGTLWMGMFFYSIRKSSFFNRTGRDLIADYALPAAVLIMSFVGSFLFSSVAKDSFKVREEIPLTQVADVFSLPLSAYFLSLLLGFSLSFLFYIDQNVTSALCSNPENKLKKGQTQNLDLLVVAILNMVLSVLGLPWVHGALPHSPLHCRALADIEVETVNGHQVEVITNVRETRLAALISHVLILLSAFFLIPNPLQLIPTSVLYGLFLYVAVTSLAGNSLFGRVLLLFTEEESFPKNDVTKMVPKEKIHLFTGLQLVQLLIFCVFGFFPYPYVQMAFPIVCILLIPVRHTLIPLLIEHKYLNVLDKTEITMSTTQTDG